MEIESKESWIQLALNAYKKGKFKTLKSVCLAFDVPQTTLQQQIGGITSQAEKTVSIARSYQKQRNSLYQPGF